MFVGTEQPLLCTMPQCYNYEIPRPNTRMQVQGNWLAHSFTEKVHGRSSNVVAEFLSPGMRDWGGGVLKNTKSPTSNLEWTTNGHLSELGVA